ncbi:MAG: SRPBCC family protein [Vicinamibacterales bacterium]
MAVETMTDRSRDVTVQPRGVETSHVNVGRVERWLSMAAGGALATYAARRRDLPGGLAAAAGAALVYRGATGYCPVNERLGRDSAHGNLDYYRSDTRERLRGARGIRVEDAVTINRPASEVYRFWRTLENLPRFMTHLTSVAVLEGGISRWVAKGPAGTSVEWDARIINEIENTLLAWQSLEGSTVASAGSVRFDETPRGTQVRVHFQYDPPAGKLGAVVARLLGEDPSVQVRHDLRRLKQLLETGEIATIEGQPSGRGRARDRHSRGARS